MATTITAREFDSDRVESEKTRRRRQSSGFHRILAPLASLKLTVALLGMGVFIVLAGTLAQAEIGIETVVNDYFRVRPWGPALGFAWIPFQIFFPESFFGVSRPVVGGGFWFPGGWLIGVGMFLNLLAAHTVRFTTQAKGLRLLAGLLVIAFGIAVTSLVVASGAGANGLQGSPLLSWDVLWRLFQGHLLLIAAANVAAVVWSFARSSQDKRLHWIVALALPITVGLAAWSLLVPSVGESSMRILWQLIKGGMAALVLLAGCWIVFRKRAGIVLLHAGVGLLMISELIVGLLAVETRMSLSEGETAAWADDIRTVELAIVDPSHPDHDVLTRIPASRLQAGRTISHESIPFDIRIDQYFKNAAIASTQAADENPADSGHGRNAVAVPAAENAGASSDGEVDQPAAYVTLTSKNGGRIGTYLLSSQLAASDLTETVETDGKEWQVALRFQRDYKPYAITLLDVRKDDYVGTDTPKNYSSDIRVVSEELGADFERHVWMNNPLRFAGETIYQSGYHRDRSGREYTTFQIVRNTGWMLPYVACMIVVIGMAAQFLVTLTRFLGRQVEGRSVARVTAHGDTAPRFGAAGWILPTVVVLLFGGWLAGKFAPPREKGGEPNLVAFGELPVASHGRMKPLDTVARDALKGLSNNRQEFKTGQKVGLFSSDEKKPAIQWLLELIATPEQGAERNVVRIDNDELLSVLQLPLDRADHMYSLKEVLRTVPALAKRMDEVRAKSERKEALSAGDRGAQDLQQKVGLILVLVRAFGVSLDLDQVLIDGVDQFRIDNATLRDSLQLPKDRKGDLYTVDEVVTLENFRALADRTSGLDAASEKALSADDKAALALEQKIRAYLHLQESLRPADTQLMLRGGVAGMQRYTAEYEIFKNGDMASKIPSRNPPLAVYYQDKWETLAHATLYEELSNWASTQMGEEFEKSDSVAAWQKIKESWKEGDTAGFNAAVKRYHTSLAADPPKDYQAGKVNFEAYFNHAAPFYYLMIPYVVAALLAACSWLGFSRPLNRSAFWLVCLTFALHTLALVGRIYISGRPPVTNLYSSAIFIGWAAVAFGVVLELVFRLGFGNVMAGVIGFATLLIAHNLSGDGSDTFSVLQAVLDTQFWLATHVVTITLGYSASYVAGFLGLIYVILGLSTRLLNRRLDEASGALVLAGTALATGGIGAAAALTSLAGSQNQTVGKALIRMIYGVSCFALLFSFFGTVLGGLWADDSWGRFWGWDPKENGALIIVLWNAIVLHARWGGMVKDRGLALLAVAGNVAVSWSWFGTNQLGVGLHSYGFTSGVVLALALFVLSQLVVVAAGCLPKSWWSSYKPSAAA